LHRQISWFISAMKLLCAKCGDALLEIQTPSFSVPRDPSQSHANLFRKTLWRVQNDISRLDDEIKRLQDTTEQLLKLRQNLSKHVNEHEALLSPVQRLPPELLSKIFVCLLPSKPSSTLFHSVAPRTVVMLPGQVCSRWRNAALSTPELYTSFAIMRNRGTTNSEIAFVDTWLKRSGSLTLTLDCNAILMEPILNSCPAMDQVLPHSNRWRSISLTYLTSSIPNLDVIKGHLQDLERLSLVLQHDYNRLVDAEYPTIDVFEIAPRLRILTLCSSLPIQLFKFPWEQLIHLSLDGRLSIKDFLDLLANCPNLISCCLTRKGWSGPPLSIQHSPILLLQLRSLSMDVSPQICDLFAPLSLPALRKFKYSCRSPWNQSLFLSLLSRSNCSLQKFTFRLFDIP
jgi:hypothetical protein